MSQQTIPNIFPNISRFKGNQTMKFRQFIQYNMRNIFVEKSYAQCVGETIPRSFSEKPKLTVYLWINNLKFYTVWFN